MFHVLNGAKKKLISNELSVKKLLISVVKRERRRRLYEITMILQFYFTRRALSTAVQTELKLNGKTFERDNFTNITPIIIQFMNRKLYMKEGHPLSFIRERIVNYFHQNFKGRTGNSIFSVHDQLEPIVTTHQNFDSLLVPKDHVSRAKCNCYYINKDILLRGHMTAHQSELIKMGLNNFLMVGDVFRRDDINKTHYPVFHQMDGVRLFSPQELLASEDDGSRDLTIKRDGNQMRSKDCQESYTSEASKKVEEDLKRSLEGLSKELFGDKIKYQWVDAYFPFTHPSWELEILLDENWFEILGCGIIENKLLQEAGCDNQIGWAFGLGLERLAMIQYSIPDIRIFWSTDPGFLCQFAGKTYKDAITYKPVSSYPPCIYHLSFWIPDSYSSNDFYDLVRSVAGNVVEKVHLIDEFKSKENGRISHCYEITYRHMEKTFTKSEVNTIHKKVVTSAAKLLNVVVR